MSKSRTILCIDDDQMINEVVQGYFELRGYQVLVAENGKIGMDLCKLHQPDVVMVDLNMPVMNGFQVLEEMGRDFPDTPTIVISGEGEMEDVIRALHLGAWHYLTKPIDNYNLLEHAVKQTLEKAMLVRQSKAQQTGLERKLADIFEQFQDFVVTCDEKLVITYMNPSLVDYLGVNQVGKTCEEVFWAEKDNCSWWPDDIHLSGGAARCELQNPNDGNWYDVTHLTILDYDEDVAEYQVIMQDITSNKDEVRDLQEREEILRDENSRLLASLSDRFRFGNIIGKSVAMQDVYKTIISAAGTEVSVIVYGESGTGKELVARSIHENSSRKNEQFVCVNCGAIPENLIESEFFGYKKGAFSGATRDKLGFLDVANGGTLFLDEVGEIPPSLQIKLLRAIEGGGFSPLGSSELKKPDFRIIAATNRNLKELVKYGVIREDFLYRIHVIPVHLPPLRERYGDIPILIDHFLEIMSSGNKVSLSVEVLKALQAYKWPGNVRELQNTIQRFLAIGKLDFMSLADFATLESFSPEKKDLDIKFGDGSLAEVLDDVERKVLIDSCERCNWHQIKTAKFLQINRKTLYRKMKYHKITKPKG